MIFTFTIANPDDAARFQSDVTRLPRIYTRPYGARSPCPSFSLSVTPSDPCTRRQPRTTTGSGLLAASS